MSDIEARLNKVESKVSTVEREFNNSWAYGSRSEYEDRFKHQVINQLVVKVWMFLAGIITVLGTAFFIYIGITIEAKIDVRVNEEIEVVKQSESERLNKIIANFDWRQSHDFGYVYRNLAKVFWEDKTIEIKNKKRWISQVLKLASEKLDKAKSKDAVKGATFWELGNLAYTLPVKYKTETEDPEQAEKYFEKAIRLYEQQEIKEGWRGGAYEDLARVQNFLSEFHKGTNKGVIYSKKALRSKSLALRDYIELVNKSLYWRNKAILKLQKELNV